jgi:hypothetical protein
VGRRTASKAGVPIPPMVRAAPFDLAGAVGSEGTSDLVRGENGGEVQEK